MDKLDKTQTWRFCNNYSIESNKEDTLNLQDAFKVSLKNNQAPRYIDKLGREHIEVPAIILGEQVIHGSGGYEWGAELVTYNALVMSVEQWNDRPVVIYHTEGSATEIENLEQEKVGFIHSAELIGYDNEPTNIRIKCMLRLDVELLLTHDDGQAIIDKFDSGFIMEMSTGYYLKELIFQEGNFRGRDFLAMQAEIIPNHLALLPNAVGAYSVEDGGGANRFNQGEPMKENEVLELVGNQLDERLKVIPTDEKISELVGNAVTAKMVEINEAITKLNEVVQPLVDKKKEEVENTDKVHTDLVAKVAEKSDLDVEVLNVTPDSVLEKMLQNQVELEAIGKPVIENKEEVYEVNTNPEKKEA